MKKKIAIVGIVGVPAVYGGFETLVENLLDHLPEHYEVTVFCEANTYQNKIEYYKNAKLVYLKYRANGVQSIIYDIKSILKSYGTNDYLLILGVSGGIALPFIKRFYKGKILTNIDGLEWKRDKWNFFARTFLKFSEKLAVYYSDLLISDNQYIKEYVLDSYHKPSTLIAYGGDHVMPVDKKNYLDKYVFMNDRYFFTVCRIEPENNLQMMLEAYIASGCSIPYVIIGNWKASKFGKRILDQYSSFPQLSLLDPIYDSKELNAVRSNCFYYLHGHSAGGTNPSLVEAMYLELPIIAYDVCYNRGTTFNKAIYFQSKNQLVELLKVLCFDSSEISIQQRNLAAKSMGLLAEENYKWSDVSQKYIKAINSLN